MLIFHGLENTFGSSIVASYCSVLASIARVALGHLERVAVVVAGAIEPGLFHVIGHLDHQRLAVPPADRPSHPRRRGALLLLFMRTMRLALVNSYVKRTLSADCTI